MKLNKLLNLLILLPRDLSSKRSFELLFFFLFRCLTYLSLVWFFKWNAVALWAWDIVVDNCAICRLVDLHICIFYPKSFTMIGKLTLLVLVFFRNHIMDLCWFLICSLSFNVNPVDESAENSP